jgi:hypothetical protein
MCELHGKEIQVPTDMYGLSSRWCDNCHKEAHIITLHRGHEFNSPEEFDAFANGVLKEYRLLKRIIDGGIGTDEDRRKYEEARQFLEGITCPSCFQPLLKEDENGQQD